MTVLGIELGKFALMIVFVITWIPFFVMLVSAIVTAIITKGGDVKFIGRNFSVGRIIRLEENDKIGFLLFSFAGHIVFSMTSILCAAVIGHLICEWFL